MLGLRTPSPENLAALVVALLAERRQGDGLPLRIEHVRDPASDTLTREAQLPQPVAKLARVRHPERVPLSLQPSQNPLRRSLALRRKRDIPVPHLIGELNHPLHATSIAPIRYPGKQICAQGYAG